MPVPDSSTRSNARPSLPACRRGDTSSGTVRLTEEVTSRVNAGELDLKAGDAALAAVGLAPLEPGTPADFLVPVCLRVHAHNPDATVPRAYRLVRDDLDELAWTQLTAPPRYWHVHRNQAEGDGYATVHAELRLRVTAVACPAGRQQQTARALLTTDLRQLSEVDVFFAGIRAARP